MGTALIDTAIGTPGAELVTGGTIKLKVPKSVKVGKKLVLTGSLPGGYIPTQGVALRVYYTEKGAKGTGRLPDDVPHRRQGPLHHQRALAQNLPRAHLHLLGAGGDTKPLALPGRDQQEAGRPLQVGPPRNGPRPPPPRLPGGGGRGATATRCPTTFARPTFTSENQPKEHDAYPHTPSHAAGAEHCSPPASQSRRSERPPRSPRPRSPLWVPRSPRPVSPPI